MAHFFLTTLEVFQSLLFVQTAHSSFAILLSRRLQPQLGNRPSARSVRIPFKMRFGRLHIDREKKGQRIAPPKFSKRIRHEQNILIERAGGVHGGRRARLTTPQTVLGKFVSSDDFRT